MNIVLYPKAKINIGLRVIAKRDDGFHDIETLFFPLPEFNDIVEIIEAPEFRIFNYGKQYSLPGNDTEKDLCVRAYRILEKDFKLPPVEIHLFKSIPIGAGLGGGSSDAASVLKGLNTLFNLSLSTSRLAGYAEKLGSDCPFFIYDTPMFGRGRGEILEPFSTDSVSAIADNNRYSIKLITPEIPVSTSEAYRGINPMPDGAGLDRLLATLPVEQWNGNIVNDFESSVFALHPELAKIKAKLYAEGAVYASMSGSGSALYGIFKR